MQSLLLNVNLHRRDFFSMLSTTRRISSTIQDLTTATHKYRKQNAASAWADSQQWSTRKADWHLEILNLHNKLHVCFRFEYSTIVAQFIRYPLVRSGKDATWKIWMTMECSSEVLYYTDITAESNKTLSIFLKVTVSGFLGVRYRSLHCNASTTNTWVVLRAQPSKYTVQ